MSDLLNHHLRLGAKIIVGFIILVYLPTHISLTPKSSFLQHGFSPTGDSFASTDPFFTAWRSKVDDRFQDLLRKMTDARMKNDLLEASITRGKLELDQRRAQQMQTLVSENQLRAKIDQLRSTERPPLRLLQTPQEYGQVQGVLLRKKYELLERFPEMKQFPYTPVPGTDRYWEFVELYNQWIQESIPLEISPICQELVKRKALPMMRDQLAVLQTEMLSQALSLEPFQVSVARFILQNTHEETYTAHTPASVRHPYHQLVPYLNPQQQEIFKEVQKDFASF